MDAVLKPDQLLPTRLCSHGECQEMGRVQVAAFRPREGRWTLTGLLCAEHAQAWEEFEGRTCSQLLELEVLP